MQNSNSDIKNGSVRFLVKDRMEWEAYGEMERDANIYVWKNKMLGCVGRGGWGGAGEERIRLGFWGCFLALRLRLLEGGD